MNGAAEYLLQDILAQAKITNQNLASLLRASAGSGGGTAAAVSSGGGGGGGISALGVAGNIAGAAVSALGTAANMVSSVFSGLFNIAGQVVGAFVNLGESLYQFGKSTQTGNAKLSEFYAAFKGVPILGTFFGLLADQIAFQERLLVSYQRLTGFGFSFGGSLDQLKFTARLAGLSLEEFESVLSKNGPIIAGFAGNIDAGLRKFAETSNKLIGANGPFSRDILGLGYTAEEAGNLLGSMMKTMSMSTNINRMDSQSLAKATRDYAINLDELSKMTGKRRDQIDAEVRKAEEEAAWQVFTSGLNETQAAFVKDALAAASAMGGQPLVDAVKGGFRGVFTGVTKESTDLIVGTQGQLAGTLQRLFQDFRSGDQGGLKNFKEGVLVSGQRMVDLQRQIGDSSLAFGTGKELFNNSMTSLAIGLEKSGKSTGQYLDDFGKQQKKQTDGSAGAFAQQQQAIKSFGQTLMDMMNRILKPFIPVLEKFSAATVEIVGKLADPAGSLISTLTKVIEWFENAYNEIANAVNGPGGWTKAFEVMFDKIKEGGEKVWTTIKPGIDAIWDTIKGPLIDGLTNMFNGLIEFVKPYFMRGVQYLFDEMKGYLYESTGGRFGEDKNRSEMRREHAFQQSIVDSYEKKVRAGTSTAEDLQASLKAQLLMKKLEEMESSYKRLTEEQKKSWKMPEIRHSGTIGMTGNWWETETGPKIVQAGETVATQQQILDLLSGSSQNTLVAVMQQLNTNNQTMLGVLRSIDENSRRNVDATKALNGDLFQVA